MNLNPLTQINLFEHKEIFNQLYKLSKNDTLPNKILLSGEKGIGKSTLAYHLINFVLSENEEHPYDYENKKIKNDFIKNLLEFDGVELILVSEKFISVKKNEKVCFFMLFVFFDSLFVNCSKLV